MKMQSFLAVVCLVLGVTVPVGAHEPISASWPTFRGLDRAAVSPETGLLSEWPQEGPGLVWEANGLGRGYSSLAIADGRIYTLGDSIADADADDEYLLCLDQSNGQQLWKAKTGQAWNSGRQETWQSPRSTPSVEGNHVYAINAHGNLVCFDVSGSEVWRKDLNAEFNGKKADGWGYSESVLIDGDNLICTPGGPANTMVALNRFTGDLVWSTSRENDRGAGHASIVITEVGGSRVYVQSTGSGPMAVRASDGQLLWTYDIERTTAVIPTPIVRDDLVFFVAGYKRGGALLKQVVGSDGQISVEELYPLETKLANKHGGVVLVGDFLYGDSDDKGIPYCANLMTGELQWQGRGSGRQSASMVAADGHLYVRYANGMMTLVQANPQKFEEISSFRVPGSGNRPSWSHPVILGGKLYLREGDKLLCYNISG